MKRASSAPAATPPARPASSASQIELSTRDAMPEPARRVSTTPLFCPVQRAARDERRPAGDRPRVFTTEPAATCRTTRAGRPARSTAPRRIR